MTTIDAAVAAANAHAATEPSAPVAPVASPTPTPTETPAPAPDDASDLLAKLEARKAERLARTQTQTPQPTHLDNKVAVLEAEIARLSRAPSAPDFPTLVRQHGHVEAMRMVGMDPLEYFHEFKEQAKDPTLFQRKQSAAAEQERLAKIERDFATYTKSEALRREQDEATATSQQWGDFVRMTSDPKAGTPLLAKLEPEERMKRTQAKIAWLQANDYDVDQIDDFSLAKIVEADMRKLRDLLAGTDASVSPTAIPPTDGATTTPATATTLSNDLASQSTGRTQPMNEKQRLAAAISVMEKMNR